MAELFGVGVPAVSKHLKNIFLTGELDENSVISILETTAEDGNSYYKTENSSSKFSSGPVVGSIIPISEICCTVI